MKKAMMIIGALTFALTTSAPAMAGMTKSQMMMAKKCKAMSHRAMMRNKTCMSMKRKGMMSKDDGMMKKN